MRNDIQSNIQNNVQLHGVGGGCDGGEVGSSECAEWCGLLKVGLVVEIVVVIAEHVTQCAWRHASVNVGHQASKKT